MEVWQGLALLSDAILQGQTLLANSSEASGALQLHLDKAISGLRSLTSLLRALGIEVSGPILPVRSGAPGLSASTLDTSPNHSLLAERSQAPSRGRLPRATPNLHCGFSVQALPCLLQLPPGQAETVRQGGLLEGGQVTSAPAPGMSTTSCITPACAHASCLTTPDPL